MRLHPTGHLRRLDLPPPDFNCEPFAFPPAPPLSSSTRPARAEDWLPKTSAVLSDEARRSLLLWEATRKQLTFCKHARARVQGRKTKRPRRTSLSLLGGQMLRNKSSLGGGGRGGRAGGGLRTHPQTLLAWDAPPQADTFLGQQSPLRGRSYTRRPHTATHARRLPSPRQRSLSRHEPAAEEASELRTQVS